MKWINLLNHRRVTNDANFTQRAGPLKDQNENVKKMKTLQAIDRDKEKNLMTRNKSRDI